MRLKVQSTVYKYNLEKKELNPDTREELKKIYREDILKLQDLIKRDLTGWGSFLFMGLIGLIVASLVNMFFASSAMSFALSVISVLIFTGLTAYDTQAIKETYYEGDGSTVAGHKAIMGALRLYLDFINLFLSLLRLFGNRN